MSDLTYAEHYDATIAKNLCLECGERKPRVDIHILNDGKKYKSKGLWCSECEIKLGHVQDATESVN